MKRPHGLTDEQWAQIEPLRAGRKGDPGKVGRKQSAVCRCTRMARQNGRPLARSAREVRQLEVRVSTVQSVVQARRPPAFTALSLGFEPWVVVDRR